MVKTIAAYLKEHDLHDNHRGCKAPKRIITKEKISRSCRKPNIWRNYKYNEIQLSIGSIRAGE